MNEEEMFMNAKSDYKTGEDPSFQNGSEIKVEDFNTENVLNEGNYFESNQIYKNFDDEIFRNEESQNDESFKIEELKIEEDDMNNRNSRNKKLEEDKLKKENETNYELMNKIKEFSKKKINPNGEEDQYSTYFGNSLDFKSNLQLMKNCLEKCNETLMDKEYFALITIFRHHGRQLGIKFWGIFDKLENPYNIIENINKKNMFCSELKLDFKIVNLNKFFNFTLLPEGDVEFTQDDTIFQKELEKVIDHHLSEFQTINERIELTKKECEERRKILNNKDNLRETIVSSQMKVSTPKLTRTPRLPRTPRTLMKVKPSVLSTDLMEDQIFCDGGVISLSECDLRYVSELNPSEKNAILTLDKTYSDTEFDIRYDEKIINGKTYILKTLYKKF